MMEEVWKDIPGLENMYQASSHGRIRSLDRMVQYTHSKVGSYWSFRKGRILSPAVGKRGGYLCVVISNQGKRKTTVIHSLVAKTFLGPRPTDHDICHNDGNPKNNNIANLRYDSRKHNIIDAAAHGRRLLNSEDVDFIRNNYSKYPSIREAWRQMNFDISYYWFWAIARKKRLIYGENILTSTKKGCTLQTRNCGFPKTPENNDQPSLPFASSPSKETH